jgi:hypothetical protein
MYGIATKQAKNKVEDMNKDKLKELIQSALIQNEQGPATNVEPYHDQQTTTYFIPFLSAYLNKD